MIVERKFANGFMACLASGIIRVIKKSFTIACVAVLMVSSGASAGDWFADEVTGPYLQRTEGITAGAGDAKAVNSAIHTADPWPANVWNRHIPADGERMSDAIRRYKDVTKLKDAPPPLAPVIISPSGFSGGVSGSSGK